jgi:two-component system, OmpR family, response regulator
MAEPIYRLTEAGRAAWESQDLSIPADYRRILWAIDVYGEGGVAAALLKVYSSEFLEEWLSEMEEIGLIERVESAQGQAGGFSARRVDRTVALDQSELIEAAKQARTSLMRTGAYLSLDRLRRRPLPMKEAADTVVLIVEDDPDQLALADLRVSMAGYKVRVASCVKDLLQALLDEGAPDLLLLDVMLPDGDGFEVLRKMRRHPALGSMPIVMLTARSEPGDIGHGLALGADGYITKPYTKKMLTEAINRVLKREG